MIIKAKAVYREGRIEFVEPMKAPPDGTPVLVQYEVHPRRSFSAHFGVLCRQDADEILSTIEEACERVDRSEW